MSKGKTILFRSATATALFLLTGCLSGTSSESLSDAKKVAALKKVSFSYDSLTFQIGLPDGALGGEPFDKLKSGDPVKYTTLENYTIDLVLAMTADNTAKDARDAKFDGMVVKTVMDTLTSTPIPLKTDAFTIDKNEKKAVESGARINLKTHKAVGKYIFSQTVTGKDLATTLQPSLHYIIGRLEDDIKLPEMKKDVPTRATPEMKKFLQGLLDSGLLD